MKLTFDEAKILFPINKEYNLFEEKVPRHAHESVQNMREWINQNVANDECVFDGKYFIFNNTK